jgi:hypothetical protein
MSTEPKEQAFLAASKAILDESIHELDGQVLARLRQARSRALEAKPRPFFWLLPAGGFAAASVVILAAALWFFQPAKPAPMHGVEDLDILTSAENLELYDDLDFYHWLTEHDNAG